MRKVETPLLKQGLKPLRPEEYPTPGEIASLTGEVGKSRLETVLKVMGVAAPILTVPILAACQETPETPAVVRTPEEAGVTPSPTLEIRTPTPETIPTPTPTEVRPLPTPTIENLGFGDEVELTVEERGRLNELTTIYSQEAYKLAQENGWTIDQLRIIRTRGSQEGIVGAYLVYDEDKNFTDTEDQRYWQANEEEEVVEVPAYQEKLGVWNREKNRFEWENLFFDQESQRILKVVFTDDFAQNRGWQTSEALKISDGNLTILNQEGWLREYNFWTNFSVKGDFRVEAQMGVKFATDQYSEADLVLGIPGRTSWDDGKFYDIVLLPDGVAVRALDGTGGKSENWVLNRGASARVYEGEGKVNQLTVERIGGKFIVFLNGQLVMEFNDILFGGGEFPLMIGFNVAPGTRLEADNLEVSSPLEEEILVVTPTPTPVEPTPVPTETPSPPICEIPHFPERTPDRQTGYVIGAGEYYQLIIPEGIPIPPHYQWFNLDVFGIYTRVTKRDGRITAIDRENKIFTFDLGRGLVVQRRFTEGTQVLMSVHEKYIGMPATEAFKKEGNFCDLEAGDAASILHPSEGEGANPNPALTDLWGVFIVQ